MKSAIAFIIAFYVIGSSAQPFDRVEQDFNVRDADDIEIEVIEFPGNRVEKPPFQGRPELTDAQNQKLKEWQEGKENEYRSSPQYKEQIANTKTQSRKVTEAIRDRGYAIRPDSFFQHDAFYKEQLPKSKKPSEVEGLMGFSSPIFSNAVERVGVIQGILTRKENDGLFHELTTLIYSKPLASLVAINEVGLNDPGYGPTRIWGPKIEMSVDGNRASLAVFKNKKGDLGRTRLMIISDNILAEISIAKAITKNDPLFPELVKIAEELY